MQHMTLHKQMYKTQIEQQLYIVVELSNKYIYCFTAAINGGARPEHEKL